MKHKKTCAVKGCKNHVNEAWMDIAGHDKNKDFWHGIFHFCDAHYHKIMTYVKQKEKEEQIKNNDYSFYAFAPIELVNQALNH